MTRRRRGIASSLELLLDTICNTFGGVLFLAILISMLLQMRGGASAVVPPSTANQLALKRLTNSQADANFRLESIRRALGDQSRLIEQLGRNAAEHRTFVVEKEQRNALNANRAGLLEGIADQQQLINTRTQQLTDIDAALASAQQENRTLEERLKRETEVRTESARLPTLHDTIKREVPLCLRSGRLYRVLVHGQPNMVDFDVQTTFGRKAMIPKPNGGEKIGTGVKARSVCENAVAAVEPDISYIAVFVWPDSYGEFRQLKEVLLERGFEYRLVPLPSTTDTLFEGASDAKVLR